MTRYDLIISGRVFHRGELRELELGLKDGRVERIARSLSPSAPREDYGQLWILPGGVDPHVHFRTPGEEHKESFRTGGIAALCGGITTVLDMPNNHPPVTDMQSLLGKVERAERESPVDIGFFLGAVEGGKPPGSLPGVFGIKVYMGSTTGSLLVRDLRDMDEYLSSTDLPLTFHAEDQSLLEERESSLPPPKSLEEYHRRRPPAAEVRAVERIGEWGPPPERVHIAHVTTPQSLQAARGRGYTTEVTPHHLLLDLKNAPRGAWCKVNPPLRPRERRVELYRAFLRGEIDMLASDHAPHLPGEKEEDFSVAPAGIPGVETTLPLLLYLARRGEIPLRRLVEAISENPSRRYSIAGKGAIEEGFQADLVVVDWRKPGKVREEDLHSRAGWTPYEGFPAIFPQAVYLSGERVVEGGEWVGGRGRVMLRK